MTQENPDRTSWMSSHFGLMNHWLYPGVLPEKGEPARSLDEAVDRFVVTRLLEDIEASGASWLIFTLGQNTGCYVSPNPVVEELAGPGHCSQRDLAYEIAEELHRGGRRFIAYLPCEVYGNHSLQAGFAWRNEEGTGQAEFQRRYTRMVREWALRFGKLLDGWWFDGCYTWPYFHSSKMEWPLWFEAARAGNPEAVLTFNDGSFCVGNLAPVIPEHDYLSGEAEMLVDAWRTSSPSIRLGREESPVRTHLPDGRFIPGTRCQWHVLLPIDCFWMHGNPPPAWLPGHPYQPANLSARSAPMEPPLYSDAELGGFLRNCLAVGGAVTFNVGIFEEGHLGSETIAQISRIGKGLDSESGPRKTI